jgi:hypothetical protein
MDVSKRPGVAETIDWAEALTLLGLTHLDAAAAQATLGAVVKDHDDAQLVRAKLTELLGGS